MFNLGSKCCGLSLKQGSHASLKILESLGIFIGKFPGHEKSWKSTWKVLKFSRQRCGWQFLASNRHVSADEDSHNCCHNVRFLSCRYAKRLLQLGLHPRPAVGAYSAPRTCWLLSVALFKHCWLMTTSWKNAYGILGSAGIFGNQESRNPLKAWS